MELDTYPIRRTLVLTYDDMDAVGHVNNVAFAKYFQEGRVLLLRAVDELALAAFNARMLLAHVDIDYLAEMRYPGQIQLGIGIARIGRTSVTHGAALFQNGRCTALSNSVDVKTNVDGSPVPEFAAEHRTIMEKFLLDI
ncbi:acyl-CoA thioesterase [Rhodococcus globerulus]|jgi:acyl-CoA thioester hydrolase|uniref:acyl-CoA thioesterase n=1 Tax=Rhodococcus globerulus TaxID=33008 RepID=UPI003017DF8F